MGQKTQNAEKAEFLTKEQEQQLANAAHQGDEEARAQLICSNMHLVYAVARKFNWNRGSMTLQDLIQEGSCGLIRAADSFDPEQGFRFSTYATTCIRQAIIRSLQDQDRMIRLPAYMCEKLQKINSAIKDAAQDGEPAADYRQISHAVGMEEDEVRHVLQAEHKVLSFSAPSEDDGDITDYIPDERSVSPETYLLHQASRTELNRRFCSLDPREREVLCLKYGLYGEAPQNDWNVSHRLGIPKKLVRQIEAQALQKMREPDSLGDLDGLLMGA